MKLDQKCKLHVSQQSTQVVKSVAGATKFWLSLAQSPPQSILNTLALSTLGLQSFSGRCFFSRQSIAGDLNCRSSTRAIVGHRHEGPLSMKQSPFLARGGDCPRTPSRGAGSTYDPKFHYENAHR